MTHKINRVYGYIRISSKDQNIIRQMEALINSGVEERYIFIDKQSGKDFNRPQWLVLKNALREGDLLIIKSIDRLGRNYKEIISEWQEITEKIKTDVKILDMPLLDTTYKKDLLGNFISNLILQVLSYVAQQEREFIKKRQEEGIRIAKAQGKHLGRPKAVYPENWQEIYVDWKDNKITAKKAMELLKLKTTTFYKLVNQYNKGENE
jgi:DNA invertase Pin-like site-specific DNA recombinase